MIHLAPALVAWSQRWHPGPPPGSRLAGRPGSASGGGECAAAPPAPGWDTATRSQLLAAALPPYLAWALAFSAYQFVFAAARIREKNHMTLYKWMSRNPGGVVARALAPLPPPARPFGFMAMHACLTTAAFALSKAWWDSYVGHSAFVVALLCVSAWNGASFYFDYMLGRAAAGAAKEARRA